MALHEDVQMKQVLSCGARRTLLSSNHGHQPVVTDIARPYGALTANSRNLDIVFQP
jgi:hypothetical protein